MKNKVKKEVEKLIVIYNYLNLNKSSLSIKEFEDKIDWKWISMHKYLSKQFIREFKDKVEWEWISSYQKLSEDFIYDFQDKLDMDWLIEHELITEEKLKEMEMKNKINNRFEILDIR